MRRLSILVVALMTGACGGTGNKTAQNESGNRADGYADAARLPTLSTAQRNAVFIRAIRDARLECQHVDWSEMIGTYRGMPVWTAACSRNQVWTIVVGADGIVQILNPTESRVIYDSLGDGNRTGAAQ